MATFVSMLNIDDHTGWLKYALIYGAESPSWSLRIAPTEGEDVRIGLVDHEASDKPVLATTLNIHQVRAMRDALTRILDERHESLRIQQQQQEPK